MDQSFRKAGELYVVPDPQKRCWPESWLVITQGDGTLESDTVEHGIFWHREDAELFTNAFASHRKQTMSSREWLNYLHSEEKRGPSAG